LRRLIFVVFEACFEAWLVVSLYQEITTTQKRMLIMKNKLSLLVLSAQKINRQHLQLVFVFVSLALLILGVGAPTDGGGIGR
jgi:hypothetical protein